VIVISGERNIEHALYEEKSALTKVVLHSFPGVIQYVVVLSNDPACVGTREYRSSPPQLSWFSVKWNFPNLK